MHKGWMVVIAALAGCTTGTETGEDRASAVLALSGDAASGASLFIANGCPACHAADGSGGTGPDITNNSFVEDDVVDVLLNGRGGMASFAQLSDQDLADVAAHVIGL